MKRQDDLSTYSPQLVTAEQWSHLADDAIALVLEALPGRGRKVRQMHLSSIVKLAAFRAPLVDSWRLDDVLDEQGVSAFLSHLKRLGTKPYSIQNHRTRLQRLLRVKAGLPRLRRRQQRDPGPAPYSRSDLCRLVDAVPEDLTDSLAAAIVVGAGAGLQPPGWYDARIDANPQPVRIVRADGHVVVARELGWLPTTTADRLTEPGWDTVRRWARTPEDLPDLTYRRLRATFGARVLTGDRSTATDLLRQHSLGRTFINGLLPHLPAPAPEDAAAWLRGSPDGDDEHCLDGAVPDVEGDSDDEVTR